MSNEILADVSELLNIGKEGHKNIENIKDEIDKLKDIVSEIEDMDSPSYLKELCEDLTDFANGVDEDLLDNIVDFYDKLSDISEAFEDVDADIAKEVQ